MKTVGYLPSPIRTGEQCRSQDAQVAGPAALADFALQGLRPGVGTDVAADDLEQMLQAVAHRLRLLMIEPLGGQCAARMPGSECSVQASVLECADALDQLHASLVHMLTRHQQLELFDARAALAQANAELAGAQTAPVSAR